MEKFGNAVLPQGRSLGRDPQGRSLCTTSVRSRPWGSGQDGEGSGASLQLAAQESFDQAWGSLARPGEPRTSAGICVLRAWFRLAEEAAGYFLLFVGLSFVLGVGEDLLV